MLGNVNIPELSDIPVPIFVTKVPLCLDKFAVISASDVTLADKYQASYPVRPAEERLAISCAVVFLSALLSSASPINTMSDPATVAEVALFGAIANVDENAPDVAVAPPDNPEVPAVVTVTPVISPSPINEAHDDPL